MKLDKRIGLAGGVTPLLPLLLICSCLCIWDVGRAVVSSQHVLLVRANLGNKCLCEQPALPPRLYEVLNLTHVLLPGASGSSWQYVFFCYLLPAVGETQIRTCIFFLKCIRLHLSCYRWCRQWHSINLHQLKFTVTIFTSIAIHRMDLSPPDPTLTYWFLNKASYTPSIFSLALSLPSNLAFARPSVTWQSTATKMLLMAQIQCCSLCNSTCNAERGRRAVCLWVRRAGAVDVHLCMGPMCLLRLRCWASLRGMLIKPGARNKSLFLPSRRTEFAWSDT